MLGEHRLKIIVRPEDYSGVLVMDITLPFVPSRYMNLSMETEYGVLELNWRDTDRFTYDLSNMRFIVEHFFKPMWGLKDKQGQFVKNEVLLMNAGFKPYLKGEGH